MQVPSDVAEVLTPLAEATVILTTETNPAAGSVYVLLREIGKDMEVLVRPAAATTQSQREESLEPGSDEETDEDTEEGDDS